MANVRKKELIWTIQEFIGEDIIGFEQGVDGGFDDAGHKIIGLYLVLSSKTRSEREVVKIEGKSR